MLRSHAQRVSGLLKNDEKRAEVKGKAGRDVGTELQTRSGKGLMEKKVRLMESKRLRPSPSRADFEKLSAVGAGYASGPYPKNICCVVEAQRMVQPDGWSSRSSSARVRREQMSAPATASGRSDGLENEGIRQKRSINRSPFHSRVDKIGFQSRVISQPRCRAKLHGIFKQAQRQISDGRFFLLVGGYDQLVGNQIARLSSCGVVILSEFLSPNFDLNSSTVRNVLHGWIAHGDVAVVLLTQPLTSSTAACLLKTCHQANVVSFHAELIHNTVSQSFEHWVNSAFGFQREPVDMCAFGLPFRKRFIMFSVNVPVHLKLARLCNIFGNVCSFSGKAHQQLGPSLKVVSSIELTEFDMRYLLLVHLFTRFMRRTVGQTSNVGWAESWPGAQMGWTWVAVRGIRAESS